MKIIITESQITEITKFNKENLKSDKITKLIEKLVLNYVEFPICDLAVVKNETTDIYVVLVLTPHSSRLNDDWKIQKLINQFIPVQTFVLVNESECDDFIN
jgi:hypothetical protein